MLMSTMRIPIATLLLPVLMCPATPGRAEDAEVIVFDQALVAWDQTWEEDQPGTRQAEGLTIHYPGHTIERTISLPPAPANQRDARRIVAVVEVDPIISESAPRRRPNDPWTRLGCITLMPGGDAGSEARVELIRFITGYGAPAAFEQDVTALAPLLRGRQTFRAFITTYSVSPGWRLTLTLRYTAEGVGQRRPVFAHGVFDEDQVTAAQSRLTAGVMIPDGLDLPRLRITSTGHATDGSAENEFVSCTHVLRVDGKEIARWRPWSERGGPLRDLNPWAGRRTIDGRELRASDFDRSGWNPGLVVDPLIIPVPELTAGNHAIELEILGIRPKQPPGPDEKEHFGYWRISAIVVADEPWPEE
jgi:hypothetical protein